jgi:hypothetical protein
MSRLTNAEAANVALVRIPLPTPGDIARCEPRFHRPAGARTSRRYDTLIAMYGRVMSPA